MTYVGGSEKDMYNKLHTGRYLEMNIPEKAASVTKRFCAGCLHVQGMDGVARGISG